MDEEFLPNNPLRIIEDDLPALSKFTNDIDNSDDNESTGEIFDFSASDVEELEQQELKKRNSLLIIEDKDLMMDTSEEDFNNNQNSNNIHRLSLQIESADNDSLIMTNEAVNRTIIRIGSNGDIDFNNSPRETINHDEMNEDENDVNGDQVIVNILGQINELVGLNKYLWE